ncbi:MAG: hypothetical protein HUU32_20670 [Calditrichaceae bacterium]|nr:hypothetical protein [Calditrichia bacterium]NUQ43813.1 hypothetical protein [Calditrichaceae bacterium]
MLNFFNSIVSFVSGLMQTNPILGVIVMIALISGAGYLIYRFWNFAISHYLTWLAPLAQTLPLSGALLLKDTIRAQLTGETVSLFITILCIVYFTLTSFLYNMLLEIATKKSKNGQLIITILGLIGAALWGVLLSQALFDLDISGPPVEGGGEGGGGRGGEGGGGGEPILPR